MTFEEKIQFAKDCCEPIEGREVIEQLQETINRQKAEIDRLNSELKATSGAALSYKAEIERLITELYELAVENERLDDAVANGTEVCHNCHLKYAEKIEQAKAEAVKEFAERLKEQQRPTFPLAMVVDVYNIDNLVKEMVGAESGK